MMATSLPPGASGQAAAGEAGSGTPPTWAIFPSDEILASVATAPVPDIPLADLREALVPQFDDRGRLIDWFVTMPPTPGQNLLSTYWAWRRNWASFWSIGSRTSIITLLDRFGAGDLPLAGTLVRLLRRLTSSDEDIVLSPIEADAIEVELPSVERNLASLPERGFGLIDDMPSPRRTLGIARGWAARDADVVLSGTDSTAVILRAEVGLVVRHGGPTGAEFRNVRRVDLRPEPAVLENAEGERLTLTPEAARPLAWLLPRSLVWHVDGIRLVDVWQPLLTKLPVAINAARDAARPLRFTTQSPVVGTA